MGDILKKKSLEQYCLVLEPHDYQIMIEHIKPMLKNPHCGDLARELIKAFERAKVGKVFHIFVETCDDVVPARFMHNDMDFKNWSDHS